MIHTGSCYCGEIKYEIDVASPDEARTSLCHCKNCKVTIISKPQITQCRSADYISRNYSAPLLASQSRFLEKLSRSSQASQPSILQITDPVSLSIGSFVVPVDQGFLNSEYGDSVPVICSC
jgi:hypothetical protein